MLEQQASVQSTELPGLQIAQNFLIGKNNILLNYDVLFYSIMTFQGQFCENNLVEILRIVLNLYYKFVTFSGRCLKKTCFLAVS